MKGTDLGTRWLVAVAVVLAALIACPAFAGQVLTQGADLWETATGFSYSSFASEPIPAGFFCEGSKPFTGIVSLRGRPLATEPAGALGNIDTIVRRLDDAVLDDKGQAATHIQLMALSLASVKPIDTGCGLYDVTASLAGRQPITTMKIRKTSQGGGSYIAPLELNVKLVFTPVSGKGERRELFHHVSMGPGSQSVWSFAHPTYAEKRTVRVDTDGDGVPDTVVPGPSNFRAGVAPAMATSPATPLCTTQSCHCDPNSTDPNQSSAGCDHLHCVTVQVPCPSPTPAPAPDPSTSMN